MNNKNFFRISLTVLLTVIAIAGCKKDTIGSVSGIISVYDPSTPLVKTPLDSIKVYLINMDFEKDTVNPKNNRAALIDSTNTDAAGKYTFTTIPEGKYSVVPVLDKVMYRFLPDSPGGDPSFSITADGTVSEINFTAPIPDSNNDDSKFHMTIRQINRPADGTLGFDRRHWWGPIPVHYIIPEITADEYLYEAEPGWTCGVYTVDNQWIFYTYRWVDGKKEKSKEYPFAWATGTITKI